MGRLPSNVYTVDVFFCSAAQSLERIGIARRCQAVWEHMNAPINLRIITPRTLGVSRLDFQKDRRIYADQHSKSKYYIVADDDCFPQEGCVPSLLSAIATHKQFIILSALPTNCTIQPWTPEGYQPAEDDYVMEHVSVGGIRMCRQGMIPTWPPLDGPGYDMAQAEAIRKLNWRVGYALKAKMIHEGEGKTTVWQTTNKSS